MDILEAIRERHSVRKYTGEPIGKDAMESLTGMIATLNKKSGLNMQLVTNEPLAFSTGIFGYGIFKGVTDYIMIVGKDTPQTPYVAGYYGEQLVIHAQRLGLRTCWVVLTYKKIPGAYEVGADEKAVCCIAIGHGENDGAPHKVKTPEQVSNAGPSVPEWFVRGVDTALLAPTAVNQQKFHFEYLPPATPGDKAGVRARKTFSLVGYTKIDLGIAMWHFAAGAGEDNFVWIDPPFKIE